MRVDCLRTGLADRPAEAKQFETEFARTFRHHASRSIPHRRLHLALEAVG